MLRLMCLIVLVAASSSAGAAGQYSVGELYGQCQAAVRVMDQGERPGSQDSIDAAVCVGTVTGFVDGLLVSRSLMQAQVPVCYPDRVSSIQKMRVFVKWAASNPEHHHGNYALGLLASQVEAFPCARRGK